MMEAKLPSDVALQNVATKDSFLNKFDMYYSVKAAYNKSSYIRIITEAFGQYRSLELNDKSISWSNTALYVSLQDTVPRKTSWLNIICRARRPALRASGDRDPPQPQLSSSRPSSHDPRLRLQIP